MFSQFVQENKNHLENIALAVRLLGMDGVFQAKSGHTGVPLGAAELGSILYFAVMNYDPKDPHWINRDRFILSNGHGSMMQYTLLHLAGFPLSKNDLMNFRQLKSLTPGHPEYGHTLGVECTTGPLGQGISHAIGLALAERMLAARFNDLAQKENLIEHCTYTIVGDGCLMEGISAEASSLAGHLKLNRLIVLYDANNITIDGLINISFSEDVGKRYEAYGWNVLYADGHDFLSLASALDIAHLNSEKANGNTGPTLIICKTIAGKGAVKWEGKPKIHGNPMTAEDIIEAKKHLGVENTESFFIPEKCYESARYLMTLKTQSKQQWTQHFKECQSKWNQTNTQKAQLWADFFEKTTLTSLTEEDFKQAQGNKSTRYFSGKALIELAKKNPNIVGGSADLAESNCTILPNSTFISANDFSGRNIHFGVREHAMAAISNGITLHGGLRAYCATFAVFSDYLRPALRLAALMQIPTIFILTHDSYAVGEDGPTHQPIEHAASMRVIPNLQVYRPADALETFCAWDKAILSKKSPTVLLLTRQDIPDLNELIIIPRELKTIKKGIQQGAYLLKDYASNSNQSYKLVLIASGSECSVALSTAFTLEKECFFNSTGNKVQLNIRVVSAPAPQELVRHPDILNSLIPKQDYTIAIEAGVSQSWGEIVGRNGSIMSLNTFGISAPASVLAKCFGFMPEQFRDFILNQLGLKT